MSVWFTASAITPELQARWALSPGAAGWLTTNVQLGFVAGTAAAALLNLADIWPSRWYVATCCLGAAVANALVAVPGSFATALVLRFLTGLFLAGVYPPAMKMMATWFVANRGLAIGALVGALTIGKALPYLINASGPAGAGATGDVVILSASAAAIVAAALIALLYHDGPHRFERRQFSWQLVGTVIRHRETRLAISGYLGHMWELYACWATIGLFFSSYLARSGMSGGQLAAGAATAAFATIAVGGLGCVLAGWIADRWGRENVASWAMIVSGTCALLLGWLIAADSWVVMTLSLLWGFTIVADSAQFSAIVTEVAPKHAVGTALTMQTSLGFALTAVSIWFTIEIATRFGWGPAFTLLAIGPVLGVLSMLRLKVVRSKPH